jgi:hypothetical protein
LKYYVEREGKTLKVEVSYSKGGHNNWHSREEKRGYYLHVSPVQIKDYGNGVRMESYVAFSGYKQLLKEVGRKSAKAQAEAEKISEEVLEEIIEAVLRKSA